MGLMMAITEWMHAMMYDWDDDGVAAVMTEMPMMTAGLLGTNVHSGMTLVTMDMTVPVFAEMMVTVLAIGITMVTAL